MTTSSRLSRAIKDPVRAGKAAVRKVQSRGRGGQRAPGEDKHAVKCLVCGSPRTRLYDVEVPRGKYTIRICQRCQYVSNFGNTVDYTKFESLSDFSLTARVGTAQQKGREFEMAKMASDILGRKGLSVMVFGAGRSLDYVHIGNLPTVKRVVMSDVVDLRHEAEFVNIITGTSERFDLIIACEVVEHFTDPKTEFPRLFDLLKREGLLVCSTNIYDGGHPSKHGYLYLRGHTSYYSPGAIATIAKQSKIFFDFRMPRYGKPWAVFGKNKRYVLFTRSVDNLQKIAQYFGNHPYAPAETLPSKAAAPVPR
jgi:SAM-dependent methyltransferase